MRQYVSKTTVSGLALKVGMGVDRFVCLRIGNIDEERLLCFGLALDEIDGVIGDFPVDGGAFCATIHFVFFGYLAALRCRDVSELDTSVLLEAIAIGPEGSIR